MKYQIDGQGVVSLPGSKSIAIRVLIIATFLREPVRITNFPRCEDCLTLLEALKELGFVCSGNDDSLTIIPPEKINPNPEIYIKDSAAALRFILFRLAGEEGLKGTVSFSSQLAERPLEPLIELINSMGGDAELTGRRITLKGSGSLSFTGKTGSLIGKYSEMSSQFLSGIIMSAPLFKKGFTIDIPYDQVSASYLDLTLSVMKSFGIDIPKDNNRLHISSEKNVYRSIKPLREFRIEEDFSSACYFWSIGALSSKPVGVRTESLSSQQPDFLFPEMLRKMGAEVTTERDKDSSKGFFITVRKDKLHGIRVNMKEMPDQVPTLAVLALFADSPTKITNISHLRYKESDRISSLITELRKIAADIRYEDGTLSIKPLKDLPSETTLNTKGDHRLVMAFTILTLAFKEIRLDLSEAVSKSFPGFFTKLREIIEN